MNSFKGYGIIVLDQLEKTRVKFKASILFLVLSCSELTALIEHLIVSVEFLNGNKESKQHVIDLCSDALHVP